MLKRIGVGLLAIIICAIGLEPLSRTQQLSDHRNFGSATWCMQAHSDTGPLIGRRRGRG